MLPIAGMSSVSLSSRSIRAAVGRIRLRLIDDVSTTTELIHFQQMIFLQDRIILENQRPVLLPLEPRKEVPTRADASSIAYRRWLKEKGVTYGATTTAA